MTALVALAGLLALSSGLVKIFGKGRTPGAVPLFALLEVIAGFAAPIFALTQKPPPVVAGTILFFLIALVIVSSVTRAMELKAQRRRRELSESARLSNYIDHLSAMKETPPGPSGLED